MSTYTGWGMNSGSSAAGPRNTVQDVEPNESGSRRRKLAGYIRAANELRQTYQQSWNTRDDPYESAEPIPGSFPGNAAAKSGEEEMVIFPSYARRHVKQKVYILGDRVQLIADHLNSQRLSQVQYRSQQG